MLIIKTNRSDRRFVVKRYIERVLTNSTQWKQLAESSFSNLEPIAQAYTMTDNEVKLMHHIFAWHLNGTFKFPIIAGRKSKMISDSLLKAYQNYRDLLIKLYRGGGNQVSVSTIIETSSHTPSICFKTFVRHDQQKKYSYTHLTLRVR